MSEDRATGHLGWFGKIPALGDFANRGLPPGFIRAWDDWLCAELQAARSTWSDAWAATYRAAPTLCFTLSAGTLDEHAWHGLLLPSVDRVGREFPLTIAGSRAPQDAAPPLSWWQASAGIGRRVVAREYGADEFSAALRAVPAGARRASPAGASHGSDWWPLPIDGEVRSDASLPTRFEGLPRGEDLRKLWGRG